MSDKIHIAIVDDHPIYLSGLRRALRATADFKLVGEGASAADAIALAERDRPNVMLLDIALPGDGLTAARTIIEMQASIRVLLLTASTAADHVTRALKIGAAGYLLKGAEIQELRSAIRAVHKGHRHYDPKVANEVLETVAIDGIKSGGANQETALTDKERQLLAAVELGQSNKEIARDLGLAVPTIKNSLSRILRKLQARNRTEAVRFLKRDQTDRG